MVLANTSAADALAFANRLREKIAESEMRYESAVIKITVSMGICDLSTSLNNSGEWLSRADQALYDAKEAGRNCCMIYQQK